MTRHSVGVAFRAGAAHIGRAPDWFLERLATLPSTNVRIFVTLVVFLATALRYLSASDGWTPSLEWCGLIIGLSGMDAAQFFAKRRTNTDYLRAQNGHDALPPEHSLPEGQRNGAA